MARKRQTGSTIQPSRKAVIYARVSSKEQEKEGYSIDAQLKLLRDYAVREGFEVVKEYVEAETARKAGRRAFNEMLSRVRRRGDIRAILIEKTDRMLRNLKDWVTVDDLVNHRNVEIHLPKEGDVISRDSRSSAKFMFGIRVLMSRQYSDNLSEETSKGMKEKAEQGIYPSFAPIGYLNTPDKMIEMDPERGPLVGKLFDLYATGNYSISEIAKEARKLGLTYRKSGAPVTKSSVRDILHNRLYTGWFEWNGNVYRGTHTPVISTEVWERVQSVFADRGTPRRKDVKHVFAFSQLIKCAQCGCLVVGERKNGKYTYYHCTGYSGGGKPSPCASKYVREEAVERQFTEILGQLRIDSEIFEQICKAVRASHSDVKRERDEAIQGLQAEHDNLRKRIDAMYTDKLDGKVNDDYFLRLSRYWRREQARILDEIYAHQNSDQSCMEDGIRLLQLGTNAHSVLGRQDDIGKRGLLKLLLWNLIWDDGKVSATFRKPFDTLAQTKIAVDNAMAENAQNENWLPGPDSNQRHGG